MPGAIETEKYISQFLYYIYVQLGKKNFFFFSIRK